MTIPGGSTTSPCLVMARLSQANGHSDLSDLQGWTAPLAVGRPPTVALPQFEHILLHLLASHDGPLGASTLLEGLQALGFPGSEPTIGRYLRLFDRRGVTTCVSNRGRLLTDLGRQHLADLCQRAAQRLSEHELLRTIHSTTTAELLDVLITRRALERESAHLAALHATPGEVAQMAELTEAQRRALAGQWVAIDSDLNFHMLVARAGRNRVLTAAIDLIQRNLRLTVALNVILRQTAHPWIVGHEQILDAIRRRAPVEAEQAMLDHINMLIAEVRHHGEVSALVVTPTAGQSMAAPETALG